MLKKAAPSTSELLANLVEHPALLQLQKAPAVHSAQSLTSAPAETSPVPVKKTIPLLVHPLSPAPSTTHAPSTPGTVQTETRINGKRRITPLFLGCIFLHSILAHISANYSRWVFVQIWYNRPGCK